jgi:hypothetical protein
VILIGSTALAHIANVTVETATAAFMAKLTDKAFFIDVSLHRQVLWKTRRDRFS